MQQSLTPVEVNEAVEYLNDVLDFPLQAGLVLGSGLGALADELDSPVSVPYEDIPNFPRSTVQGHRGRFVFGFLDSVAVAVMQGRVHFYEGLHPSRITMGVRLMARLGIRGLFLTNAAGAVNADYNVGDFMLLNDHINLMGDNPLIGPHHDEWGARFVDLSKAYDPEFISYTRQIAEELSISLQNGVYAAMSGPSYETPAEVRMLGRLGADAAGMSTVPEVIAARQHHIRVWAMSLITNMGAGLAAENLDHSEVMQTADARYDDFKKLMTALLKKLDAES